MAPLTMITIPSGVLTDYHVSRTLGYIDACFTYTDSLGGETAKPPTQVPITPEIQALVDQLDAAICAVVVGGLAKKAGVSVDELALSLTPVPLPVSVASVAPVASVASADSPVEVVP